MRGPVWVVKVLEVQKTNDESVIHTRLGTVLCIDIHHDCFIRISLSEYLNSMLHLRCWMHIYIFAGLNY